MAKEYKVGNPITVMLNDGRVVEAKICVLIEDTEGLQVDYGHDETALIHEKR
jgi:hypothetical protein